MAEKNSTELAARCKTTFLGIFVAIWDGLKYLATEPLKWGLCQWVVAIIFISSVVLAYIWKRPIQCFFRGNDAGFGETIADIGKYGGDFPMPLAIGFLLSIGGCIANRKIWLDTGVALLAAAGLAGILTPIGQFILSESRPHQGGELIFFHLGGHGISGHATASALLLWPIMHILFKEAKKILRTVAYILLIGWPCLVGWSRMWDDKHYLWNVLLGFAVGFSSGYAVVKSWEKISSH